MKKLLLMKTTLLLCALIVGSSSVWAQSPATIYSESFGDNGNNNTAFASYSGYSATTSMFTGTGTVASHYTGNGKVGKNNVSVSDYTGASGLSAAWYTGVKNTTTDVLIISGINISGYNNLNLSFGMNMTNGASNTNTTTVSYKIDNGDFQTLSFTHPTSSGWGVKTGSISGTGSSLTIKFTMAVTGGFTTRYDDIKVTGVSSLTSSEVSFGSKTPSINYPASKTYSQAPTTAAGYSGTITYSMTENTAGATINESTGVVTVTKGGSVTVKATAAAVTGSFTSSEDTYTLTVNDTRAESDLAWSANSANVTYGANNNVFPTLTNSQNLPITYSSTNTDAATIDNNGVITLKDKTASTQIKAIFAGNDDYKDVTVSYTLNVTEGPFTLKDGVFDFVKASTQNPLVDYGSGMILSTSYTTTDKTWTAGNVKMVTSKVSGNGYRWYTDGTLRFYNESKATFSVPSGYVITKIVTTGANFNSANEGTLSGSTWKGASNEVALTATATKNIETITVTYTTANQSITPAKTYTTLTSAYALDFTGVSGLKAFIATEIADSKVQMTQVNKVPANTGLVLKTTTPGSAVNVPVFDGKTPDNVSGNKMVGSATATTAIAENGGYILSNGVFQPATAGTLPAGKAYLNIAVNGARSLEMSFDDENVTAIENIAKTKKNDGQYFNLAGQRVAQPTKGLYIVNGKKVIMK